MPVVYADASALVPAGPGPADLISGAAGIIPRDRLLLARAWERRDRGRSWDALYVAPAEVLGGTLLTLDRRLASVTGLDCLVEVIEDR